MRILYNTENNAHEFLHTGGGPETGIQLGGLILEQAKHAKIDTYVLSI